MNAKYVYSETIKQKKAGATAPAFYGMNQY